MKKIRLAALIACAAVLASCSSVDDAAKTATTTAEKTTKSETTAAEVMPETTVSFVTTETAEETEIPVPAETELPDNIVFTEETTEAAPETEAVTTAAAISDGSGYIKLTDSGILVAQMPDGHYWAFMGCYGTYGNCDAWIKSANKFAARLPDVKTYSMIIPTMSEFILPDGYAATGFTTTSQLNKIQYVEEGLEGITNIDVHSVLGKHTSEHIFSRTDHHWQPLGAYYAAKEFAKTAGVDFPDLSEYKKVTRNDYVGSMYNFSGDEHLKSDPEEFTMYISPNADKLSTTYYNTSFKGGYEDDLFVSPEAGAFYCSFLGTDDRIAKIETGVKNGRTLVIFKESYGNGLVPFLTSGFETIYVCDIRYYTPNAVQFCKDVGATDLLLAVCTYTPAGPNTSCLGTIINQ